MPLSTDPVTAAPTAGDLSRPGAPDGVRPGLLRSALAAGRLPLGALRLTILQALDAELSRRGRSPGERRRHRDRVGRFLADHADRRRVPPLREVRRWTRELERRRRADAAEAEAALRSVRLLYGAVLGRGRKARAAADDGRPSASSGPVTGSRRRGTEARQ